MKMKGMVSRTDSLAQQQSTDMLDPDGKPLKRAEDEDAEMIQTGEDNNIRRQHQDIDMSDNEGDNESEGQPIGKGDAYDILGEEGEARLGGDHGDLAEEIEQQKASIAGQKRPRPAGGEGNDEDEDMDFDAIYNATEMAGIQGEPQKKPRVE